MQDLQEQLKYNDADFACERTVTRLVKSHHKEKSC